MPNQITSDASTPKQWTRRSTDIPLRERIAARLEDLRKMLDAVGYKLKGIGCDHYAIINDMGERTDFIVHACESKIELRLDGNAWGISAQHHAGGLLIFDLLECSFEVYDSPAFFAVVAHGVYVSFMPIQQ